MVVGSISRIQTFFILYIFLYVETDNICVTSEHSVFDRRPLTRAEYNLATGFASYYVNLVIMLQLVVSAGASAVYFWSVANQLNYDEDSFKREQSIKTSDLVSGWVLPGAWICNALGLLCFLSESIRICSGFGQSNYDPMVQIKGRCMFLVMCGAFGIVSLVAY